MFNYNNKSESGIAWYLPLIQVPFIAFFLVKAFPVISESRIFLPYDLTLSKSTEKEKKPKIKIDSVIRYGKIQVYYLWL